MSERKTLARPYAEAVFRLAEERNALARWSETLKAAALIAQEPGMAALIGNPRVGRDRVLALVLELLAAVRGEPQAAASARGPANDAGDGNFSRDVANLMGLLTANNRLALLPEISKLFDELKAEAEQSVEAEVLSALPLDDQQLAKIAGALRKRLGREIRLAPKVDPALVGGMIIRAGDLVIDGSVTSRLRALSSYLNR